MTCKEFLNDVNDERFVQCQRGTIVNIDFIKSINTKENVYFFIDVMIFCLLE